MKGLQLGENTFGMTSFLSEPEEINSKFTSYGKNLMSFKQLSGID